MTTTGRVLLAAPRGYCAGVERAIEIVERALELYGPPIYVRKQIVHNTHVVADLSRRGAVFIEELHQAPDGARVIFSAHGVSPAVRAEADRRGQHAIDATCPLVAKVHAEARRYATAGRPILLIGHAGHEEIDGTLGEASTHTRVVDPGADPATLPDLDRPVWLSQTTLAADEVTAAVHALRGRYPDLADPPSEDICYASTNRQNAVTLIAPRSQLVLVVGSTNSSNSVRLVEVALHHGAPAAYLIDQAADLCDEWFAGVRTVGVTAGASASEHLVTELLSHLAHRGYTDIEHVTAAVENITFTLPPALRPTRPDAAKTPVAGACPVPRHVGIVLDGNRRWARRQGLASVGEGHRIGFGKIPEVLGWCEEAGIATVTLWMLSDDNIANRSTVELADLYRIDADVIADLIATGRWRLRHLGRPELLPDTLAAHLHHAETTTADHTGMLVNLALGHGGRGDLLAAVRALVRDALDGDTAEVTAERLSAYLATAGQPDPDLIIRTSGEQRTSGFLLWQAALAELHFCPSLWPDFSRQDLHDALHAYSRRQRRMGA